MSGTSLDGVDIVIVDFMEQVPTLKYYKTKAYPEKLREQIRQLTLANRVSIDQLCQLDVTIGLFYATVVNQALSESALDFDSISAIGCHGQTIRHNPGNKPIYTLQIGDPNTLAAKTGLTTVADFRRRDMALGGQGAPLAPAFHQYMFSSTDCDRAILNIGGIANITLLPADTEQQVTGFDTGPGNTFLDYWIHRHRGKSYDNNGDWAASGQVIDELLESTLTNEDYFSQKPPKSTGTEYFCPEWLKAFTLEKHNPADVQATLLELTAVTIASAINQLPALPTQCFVCGGGLHNRHLMQRLQSLLPDCTLASTAELGVDPDYVEAIAFAWLARQTIDGRTGNLPSVTNACDSAILGGIFQGSASSPL